MNNQMYRLLLVIMILTLVVSPLRGTLAMAEVSAVDGPDHCARMQDGAHSQSMEHMAGMQGSSTGNPGKVCDQGCDGDCCDGACGACLHGSTILSDILVDLLDAREHSVIKVSSSFSGRP